MSTYTTQEQASAARGKAARLTAGGVTWWPTRPMHEDRLLTAPVADKERAELFAQFQPLVRRLMRQYGGGDRDLAEELPGEIFCQFCTVLNAYDPTRGVPLRAYLVRALTSAVYTYARRHWRRQKREINLESEVEWDEAAGPVNPLDPWEGAFAHHEVLQFLPDAIKKLPLRQRQVVISRFYDGRSFDDIGASLGIRTATARSLLRHGLNNLRRYLAGSGCALE
jgi:RNA polymerase sigma factor (sigma-70 family)